MGENVCKYCRNSYLCYQESLKSKDRAEGKQLLSLRAILGI